MGFIGSVIVIAGVIGLCCAFPWFTFVVIIIIGLALLRD